MQSAATSSTGAGYVYERRRPEVEVLHRIVRENLSTLYAAVEQGFAGAALPGFVRRELEAYLDCGLLCRGFSLIQCSRCQQRRLVAFSCKGRGFCPACMGRRMAQGALNLVEHVLPPDVPLRQFVLTVPFELRARLAYDGALLGAVGRTFVDSVLGWYRRRMARHGVAEGRSGAVTVVQRTSQDLRCNPHFHSIFVDGVFVAAQGDAAPAFHALPHLKSIDVAELLQVIRVRVLRFLRGKGVIEDRDELELIDDALAEREPALAQLARAAVSGLGPAGPERRARPALVLRAPAGVEIVGPLSAVELGFSLHAATTVGADDARGKEQLVRYVLRPPLAHERLKLLPDELVRIELRRAFRDGTVAIDLDPLSLLSRLAASVPPPRAHSVRYAGVLGSASKWRARVVPPPPAPAATAAGVQASNDRPATHRSRWRPWAELLKRSFAIDVETCASCGGPIRLRSLVVRPASIERFLRAIGEPIDAPPRSPARDPPYYKAVLRRRGSELDPQLEMFGA